MVLSEELESLVYKRDIDRLRSRLPTLKRTLSPEDIRDLCSLACRQERNVEMAKLLFTEFGIDPSCTKLRPHGICVTTAIHIACLESDLEMIKFLVEDYRCRADQYCLFLIDMSDIYKLAFLLANGANATGVIGATENTPLHVTDSIEAVKCLLTIACSKDNQAVHAMLTAKNRKGMTASQKLLASLYLDEKRVSTFLAVVEKALVSPIIYHELNDKTMNPPLLDAIIDVGLAPIVRDDLQNWLGVPDVCDHILSFLALVHIRCPYM